MKITLDTYLKLKNACHLLMESLKDSNAKGMQADWAYGKGKEAVELAQIELTNDQP